MAIDPISAIVGGAGSIFGAAVNWYGINQQIKESQRVQGINQQNENRNFSLDQQRVEGDLGVKQGQLALGQQELGLKQSDSAFDQRQQKWTNEQALQAQEWTRSAQAKQNFMEAMNSSQAYRDHFVQQGL